MRHTFYSFVLMMNFFFVVLMLVATIGKVLSDDLEDDVINRLKAEVQDYTMSPPHTDVYFMRLIELFSSQSNAIKTQVENIKLLTEKTEAQAGKIKDLTEENKAQSNVIKAHTAKLEELTEETKVQSNAIRALTKESKAQSNTFKAQTEKIEAQSNAIKAQAERIAAQTNAIHAQAERIAAQTNAIKAQTEKTKAQDTEVKALRHKLSEIEAKLHGSNIEEDDPSVSKRILLHSSDDILRLVTSHTTEIQTLRSDLSHLQSGLTAGGSGSTYVRWGRTTCPTNGTELVYSGFAGGSHYTNTGAASNYICLSSNPLWGNYSDAHDAYATVWGTEYEFNGTPDILGNTFLNEDAPCSVCRSNRPSSIMIPGRNQCYNGWTLEYKGYLVAGYTGHAAASEFVCLDDQPEVLQSGHPSEDGKLFYFVEGRCGSLPCPPYVDGREITCVVCTK